MMRKATRLNDSSKLDLLYMSIYSQNSGGLYSIIIIIYIYINGMNEHNNSVLKTTGKCTSNARNDIIHDKYRIIPCSAGSEILYSYPLEIVCC